MLRLNYTDINAGIRYENKPVEKVFQVTRIQKLKVPFVVSIKLVKWHLEHEWK